jgi:hypothetical protein
MVLSVEKTGGIDSWGTNLPEGGCLMRMRGSDSDTLEDTTIVGPKSQVGPPRTLEPVVEHIDIC